MPQLPSSVPLYQPNQPYFYTYDNIPIEALIQREDIINTQVDINTSVLEQSAGDAGTLPVRLSQSMDSLGNLQVQAVDETLHNIGYHTDGEGPDSVQYVRMQYSERAKLSTVAEDATNFGVKVDTGTSAGGSGILIVPYNEGFLTLAPSVTVNWSVENNQIIKANVVALPSSHTHYDNISPVSAFVTPDYQTFTTGISNPFIDGSLKVYINGVRIFPGIMSRHPTSNPLIWQANYFTPNFNGLGFNLQNPITSEDIIIIDFSTEV